MTYLFVGLKYVAFEYVGRSISGNVAEYLQVLRVMRDIENSEREETGFKYYDLSDKGYIHDIVKHNSS